VAASTNTVLDGNHGSVAFTVEKSLELIEQIIVDLSGKRLPLRFELLLLRFQRF
jgi:hypothetical protein